MNFLIDRDEWILHQCRGKRVLHLGCTDWPLTEARLREGRLLHGKLAPLCPGLVGADADEDGIRKLTELMPDHPFVACKGEDLPQHLDLVGQTFDVVLAADVIEHVSNLGLFLDSCAKLLAPDGKLVITTPSAFSLKRMLFLALTGKEHVHPDHVAYFSTSTLAQILGRSGFKLESVHGFQWKNPTWINRFVNGSVWLPVWLTKGHLADELAVVANKH